MSPKHMNMCTHTFTHMRVLTHAHMSMDKTVQTVNQSVKKNMSGMCTLDVNHVYQVSLQSVRTCGINLSRNITAETSEPYGYSYIPLVKLYLLGE